jgi:hypothetical protein
MNRYPAVIIPARYYQDPVIGKFIERSKQRYDIWFGFQRPWPVIVISPNLRIYRQSYGHSWSKQSVGWASWTTIHLLNRQAIRPKRSQADWLKTLAHEHAHQYVYAIAGQKIPRWLHEGIPCVLAKQKRRADKDYLIKYFTTTDPKGSEYITGYVIVSRMLKRYGRGKFLRFLNEVKKADGQRPIEKSIPKVYGQTWSKFLAKLIGVPSIKPKYFAPQT